MTSRTPDDAAPIPLTDDLGDTRSLLTPERDPVTGARVAAAEQRAAKYSSVGVARAGTTARRLVAVGIGAATLVGAAVFVATRHHSETPKAETAATTVATTIAPATTIGGPAKPVGPLVGFAGSYRISVENVHISGASGGFAEGRIERSGTTVTARYESAAGDGSATIELAEGPATVTCAPDGWTCNMQWAGPFAVALDGSLGRAVLQRADGTPFGRSECDLPIPSDGSVTPEFGLVDERPQVKRFRLTTGTATASADGCGNAVVVAYDLVAART
jgi:hypothetical protein